jgi:hypothetical protein
VTAEAFDSSRDGRSQASPPLQQEGFAWGARTPGPVLRKLRMLSVSSWVSFRRSQEETTGLAGPYRASLVPHAGPL